MNREHAGRLAAERYDTLEDTVPSSICQAAGCSKLAVHEWCGEWGVFWLCTPHRRLYRSHDRIVSRIRNSSRRKRYS